MSLPWITAESPMSKHLQTEARVRAREAAFWLVFWWLAIHLVPVRKILQRMGTQGIESPAEVSPEAHACAWAVRRAINGACQRLGWRPTCLVRSTVAMTMLRRRGVEGTLYLATARDEDRLQAHAFVRCGAVYVAGGSEREAFTVLSSFARHAKA